MHISYCETKPGAGETDEQVKPCAELRPELTLWDLHGARPDLF